MHFLGLCVCVLRLLPSLGTISWLRGALRVVGILPVYNSSNQRIRFEVPTSERQRLYTYSCDSLLFALSRVTWLHTKFSTAPYVDCPSSHGQTQQSDTQILCVHTPKHGETFIASSRCSSCRQQLGPAAAPSPAPPSVSVSHSVVYRGEFLRRPSYEARCAVRGRGSIREQQELLLACCCLPLAAF